jgi:hypothetical protein
MIPVQASISDSIHEHVIRNASEPYALSPQSCPKLRLVVHVPQYGCLGTNYGTGRPDGRDRLLHRCLRNIPSRALRPEYENKPRWRAMKEKSRCKFLRARRSTNPCRVASTWHRISSSSCVQIGDALPFFIRWIYSCGIVTACMDYDHAALRKTL